MAKNDFEWDSEVLVHTEVISDYEKREAKVCKLKDKEYIAFTTLKFIKEAWKPVAGYSIPKNHWTNIVEAVCDQGLKEAFGNTEGPKVTVKPEAKKTASKKTTTAAKKTTAAKTKKATKVAK